MHQVVTCVEHAPPQRKGQESAGGVQDCYRKRVTGWGNGSQRMHSPFWTLAGETYLKTLMND